MRTEPISRSIVAVPRNVMCKSMAHCTKAERGRLDGKRRAPYTSFMDASSSAALSSSELEVRHFVHRVYGWMCAGLIVTGACALYMASDTSMIVALVHDKPLFYGLIFAELILVFVLAGWVQRMDATTAKLAFLLYAALTGVTLSVIFLRYTSDSIASTFFLTAGLFGALCVYGYTTKADLTSVGSLCFMGLLGLIASSVVNWWLRSSAVQWVTTYLGILIFVGLTAYDAQKIKTLYRPGTDGTEEETKEAILGALDLYLDFINLFLKLLSALGRNRD